MFQISDLITQVREYIQDEQSSSYRYTDERLYRILNNAYAEAYRIRPDLFVSLDFEIPYVSPVNAGDTFQLDQQFYMAFVDFVTAMVEFSDDEWTVDGRATAFLQLFNARLGGPRQ